MKFYVFKQIVEFLRGYKRITDAYRVDDNIIKVIFDGSMDIYFDLKKGDSFIYSCTDSARVKHYKAPFDVLLHKSLNRSDIIDINVLNNDKVLQIKVMQNGAYKANETILQLEFTGKYTNAILLNSEDVVLDALRHIDIMSSYRQVRPGVKLEPLLPPSFTPKEGEKIEDIPKYLKDIYMENINKKVQLRQKVEVNRVEKRIAKMRKELCGLDDETELLNKAEINFENGNLVLANMHLVKPYAATLKLHNFNAEEIELEIPKGARTSSEVAEIFFKRAKKAKQRAKNLHIEREGLEEKIEFLERFKANILLTKTPQELQLLFPPQKKKIKKEPSKAYEEFWIEGQKVLLGKNKKGNIELLKMARAGDIWMHIKDTPSAHIIIQTNKQNINQNILNTAAKLCVDFSTTKVGSFLVDYTFRRDVKVQSEANVLYNRYKTLKIEKKE